MKAVSLILVPLMIMFFVSLFSLSGSSRNYQTAIQTGNYSVNQQAEGVQTSTISFSMTTVVVALITAFIALGIVISLKVLGSGVGEFGVKVFIIGGLALALWGFLSAISFTTLADIPVFGLIIYFVLSACYVVGIISVLGGYSG